MCPTEMREKAEKSLRFGLPSFPFRGWENRFPIQKSRAQLYVCVRARIFFVSNFDISFPRATFFLRATQFRALLSDSRFLG